MSTAHAAAPLPPLDTGFLGHPRGLFVCFATELWERFSFYGMKFLLLLYLTKYHLFSDSDGLEVLGAYAALVYAMPVIGGLLADRYLGMRKAVIFGGVLLVLGHLGMALEGEQARQVGDTVVRDTGTLQAFYFSLALIVIGVGFLKPNISTIVGRLYGADDPRRDAGFTIFYMGINIGAFAATLLCGYLGETFGWRYGFGAAGIGMLIGLATFLYGQKHLHGLAEPRDNALLLQQSPLGINKEWTIYLCGLLAVFAAWKMLQFHGAVGHMLNLLSVAVLAGLGWFITVKCNPVERSRMLVLLVLTMSTVVFWALFEQAAASMTLYADRVLDRTILGYDAQSLTVWLPQRILYFSVCAAIRLAMDVSGPQGTGAQYAGQIRPGHRPGGTGFWRAGYRGNHTQRGRPGRGLLDGAGLSAAYHGRAVPLASGAVGRHQAGCAQRGRGDDGRLVSGHGLFGIRRRATGQTGGD